MRIADDPPALALDEVARVDQPVNIAATADGWLFVNERRGRIIAMDPASGMTRVAGWYLFSDYCSGRLFGIRSDAPIPAAGERAPAPRILLQTGANVSAFGEGADGELYLADIGSGVIYRIVAGS